MKPRRLSWLAILLLVFGIEGSLHASEHLGYVRFGEVPVPGAVVLANQLDQQLQTITDSAGAYTFTDLRDGSWTIHVEMQGFVPVRRDLIVVPDAAPTVFELKMLPFPEIKTDPSQRSSPTIQNEESGFLDSEGTRPTVSRTAPADAAQPAAEVLVINGSLSNRETRAFGNNRKRGSPLYTADLNVTGNNSALDARSFSLTGQDTPEPAYSRSEASIIVAGPLLIPFHTEVGPGFTLIYSRTQNRDMSLQTARVPTAGERLGDFSNSASGIVDPALGSQFAGNLVPPERMSPQARALLNFYPLPNFTADAPYNYQVPIVSVTHRDYLHLQTGGSVRGHQLSAGYGFQTTRMDNPNLFGFVDSLKMSAVTGTLSWSRRLSQRSSATVSYTFTRTVARTVPHFANRQNVSGNAGIMGNAQNPTNWGPPGLSFSSGIAPLFDGQHAFDRTQANTISHSSTWSHGNHAFSYGAGFRRQQLNLLSERDARGTFVFTGAASGNDFADFLLGVPAASSIAFGSPDRYFRQSAFDGFVMDDWRVTTSLTLNLGIRWEYETPMKERYGRLVNLDISPGYGAVAPVLAGQPRGLVTGQVYPASLVRPDRRGFQPRTGLAWRPWAVSSFVVRVGYGMYRDTGVYQPIAGEMSQQSPISTSLSVENSPSAPLTLANGFIASPLNTPNTFAVDPDFRVGNSQNWQLSLQHDLPGALQVTATYLGIKGTRLPQRILPHTFPSGGAASCPECPAGYVYLSSNGNSNQHAGTIQLRRRQRGGFSGSLAYTWSKSIDDSGLGGNHIAQDWTAPGGERAVSNFDQRHRMTVQAMYTPGLLAGIGTLWDGWMGKLVREWTVMTEWRMTSGSPLTPILIAPANGTGVMGTLRPDRTLAPLYAGSSDVYLNATAFSLPAPGRWGNAGRNSIRGPGQFFLDASIGRRFQLDRGVGIDLRVDFTNVLNHVTVANWNTAANSGQFGLPVRANAMRTVLPSLQVRF